MAVLKTTRRQRLIASDALPNAWLFLIVPLATVAVSVNEIGSRRLAFFDLWTAGGLLIVVVLSYLMGIGIGVVTAIFAFGPMLYDQGLRNGGPFKQGDLVQIIAGPHRDRIGRIYSNWQQETWRVELGHEANESYSDIFAAYQLLRIEHDSEKDLDHRQIP